MSTEIMTKMKKQYNTKSKKETNPRIGTKECVYRLDNARNPNLPWCTYMSDDCKEIYQVSKKARYCNLDPEKDKTGNIGLEERF